MNIPPYHTFTEYDMKPGFKIICVHNDPGYTIGNWVGAILECQGYDAEWEAWCFKAIDGTSKPKKIRWRISNFNGNLIGGNIIFWPLDKFTDKELFTFKITGKLPDDEIM